LCVNFIKQLKEKILHKLCKQETAKDSEVSGMPALPERGEIALIEHYYGYRGFTTFREWAPLPM